MPAILKIKPTKLSCFFLVCVASFLLTKNGYTQTQKPNIIFVLADDVGYKAIRCNGGNLYNTPNIDSLAQNGMRFTKCYSSPDCSPSRQALLTGKYNFRNYTKWASMRQNQKTIANIFKNAGYKTACFGKWQLDGGNNSIDTFGFDNYIVHDPFGPTQMGSRYKDPHLYTHKKFLEEKYVMDKYGPDVVSDSVFKFIDNNKSKPFFIYYPLILSHQPYSPTPKDTDAFKTWVPITDVDSVGDPFYFASMMSYMDDEIGKLISKLKETGIDKNTIVIFCGDNGTPHNVSDYTTDDSTTVAGGKGFTTDAGTHVPLMIYWPGTIKPGSVNNNLIDFTDFIPTLTDIAGITIPSTYQPLDGHSFKPQLFGETGNPREWIFCYFDPKAQFVIKSDMEQIKRWAQTETYKLYDTSATNKTTLFYDIVNDPEELSPIADGLLTTEQQSIKQQLLNVINGYVYQGTAILATPAFKGYSDSGVVIVDTILTNGGSTIQQSGIVWSTKHNPTISDSLKNENVCLGPFLTYLQNLICDTVYYARAFAINKAGIIYSDETSFKTLPQVPVALPATEVNANSFVANWKPENSVSSYWLDVSTSPSFSQQRNDSIYEGFDDSLNNLINWKLTSDLVVNTTTFGTASPSIKFNKSHQQITTPINTGSITNFSVWLKGEHSTGSSFLIEGYDGYAWETIDNINSISKTATVKKYDANSMPSLKPGFHYLRFTFFRDSGDVLLDDIKINYVIDTPQFLPGYENVKLNVADYLVTGLQKDSVYYYRVKSQMDDSSISGYSNIISVKECRTSSVQNINVKNVDCYQNNDGQIILTMLDTGLVFNWQGPNNFISSNQNLNNVGAGNYKLRIQSNEICTIDTAVNITQPTKITATTTCDSIICFGTLAKLTVNAKGGVGKYKYSLITGGDSSVFQQKNNFNIGSGSYKINVQDSNHCSFITNNIYVQSINCDSPQNGSLQVILFPNPAPAAFTLKIKSGSNNLIRVNVVDEKGNNVYTNSGDRNKLFVFGKSLAPGIYFLRVMQDENIKTLKIIKQ